MDDPIFNRLRPIVAEKLTVSESEVVPEALFIEDLGADSLGMVELGMALEEEFGIELPDEELEKIKTVEQALTHLKAKLG